MRFLKLKKSNTFFYWVLFPIVAFIGVVIIFPMVYSLYISTFDINLLKPYIKPVFVGLGNYWSLLKDARFLNSIKISSIFTLATVSSELVLGLFLALFLNRELKGKGIIRTFILIPFMITPVVVGLIWKFLYNYDLGLINFVFRLFGNQGVLWLAEKSHTLMSLVFVDIWQWTPFVAIMLIAGLQSLPVEPYEAGLVDGCSNLQMFRYITFPLLLPTILVVLLLRMMDSLKLYDLVYVMTGGGPGDASETISFYLYKVGFKNFEIGRAAAGSYFLLIVLIGISMILINLLRGKFKE